MISKEMCAREWKRDISEVVASPTLQYKNFFSFDPNARGDICDYELLLVVLIDTTFQLF